MPENADSPPDAAPPPAPSAPGAGRRLAYRLAGIGIALGLLPWLLIVPLAIYQMDFMLYTWIWPAVLGVGGVGAGLLALRQGEAGAHVLAGLAVLLGLIALVAALAGFGWMLAGMQMGM